MTLPTRSTRVHFAHPNLAASSTLLGGHLNLPSNLPSDVPEPIRRWLSIDRRGCRRQDPLPDIIDIVDAWAPMSIDRGIRIEELERRINYLEERQHASAQVSHLKADLAAAAGEAKESVSQLRGLLIGLLEAADQRPHLVGERPKIIDRFDQHHR